MKMRRAAFTVFELMVVVVVMFVGVGLVLPAVVRPRHSGCSLRIRCVNNLKQTALAFRLWSGDNGDKYPMAYAGDPLYPLINKGAEWSSAGATAKYQFTIFASMSNELSTPIVIACPEDRRTAATNFTTDLDNSHVSYFAGLDANETNVGSFLAGDRNLTNGQPKLNGISWLQTNQNIGWTKDLHNLVGNVAMGDGSVQQIRNDQLKQFLGNTGLATNRLMFPE